MSWRVVRAGLLGSGTRVSASGEQPKANNSEQDQELARNETQTESDDYGFMALERRGEIASRNVRRSIFNSRPPAHHGPRQHGFQFAEQFAHMRSNLGRLLSCRAACNN